MGASDQVPKFIADQMLGKLAKWLRMLGFDTKYLDNADDALLIRIAKEEQRILLTRDTQLCKTRPVARGEVSAVLIRNHTLEEQLLQLLEELDLKRFDVSHQICPKCNVVTKRLSSKEARGRVPSYIHRIHKQFSFCPKCSSVFWPGSHWKRITKTIDQIADGQTGP